MKQSQFYKYTTWGLLLLNISLISFFFLTKPKPGHQDPKAIQSKLMNILELDESQKEVFVDYAMEHSQQMRDLSEEQKELLKPYFEGLIYEDMREQQDSIMRRLNDVERKKLEVTYKHFQDVEALLKEEQKGQFESFVNEALRSILRPDPKRPRR